MIISAIRRKSIKNETERVSITENPFHSSEKESLRRKEGISRRETLDIHLPLFVLLRVPDSLEARLFFSDLMEEVGWASRLRVSDLVME